MAMADGVVEGLVDYFYQEFPIPFLAWARAFYRDYDPYILGCCYKLVEFGPIFGSFAFLIGTTLFFI